MAEKAVIFDMDGVLLDSPKYVWKSFNRIFETKGFQLGNDQIKRYLGRSLRDQLKMIEKDFGVNFGDVGSFSKKSFEIESGLMNEELKQNNFLIGLIKDLKLNGFLVSVGTSSFKERAEKILNILGIKGKLDILITADDVQKHKPNPEIFLKVTEKLKVNPQNCVVIEDAANGIEAAKKGNMKVIALLTDFQNKEDLKEADYIIESIEDLNIDLINNILNNQNGKEKK